MNTYIKKISLSALLICTAFHVWGTENVDRISIPTIGGNVQMNRNWVARQASYVMVDGAVLSGSKQDFSSWMKATVPGTVLTSLLNNGLIPSPYYGMNNNLIPDIFHIGNDFYTYWFVNQFQLSKIEKDTRLWLNFRGINYKADIFLNGKRITTTTHEGMFLRRSYDITDAVKGDTINTFAVIVYPPDIPGEANGGQAGDGMIARNVTMQCTPGWDWIAPIRDRNTGIWDEVTLSTTGNIRIMNPQVITKVPGVRTPGDKQANATLVVNAEVENLTSKTQTATVNYEVENRKLTAKVQLAPYEKKVVGLPPMDMKNPRLWWPNHMGKQELYNMTLTVLNDAGNTMDKQVIRFGIREVTTQKDPKNGGRTFYVNGQKVFVRGGNYIASDWMLQLSPERYRTEVRFLADMNLNMIRVWGGAIPERPEFYNACDEYGMMVFQDLPISGDGNGAWFDPMKKESQERRQQYPDNHELFIESVIDEIKMLRNHPSLAIWCGGNEWPAPADIAEVLHHEIMPKYDNTRYLAPFSTDTTFTRNYMGGNGDGPYNIQEPEYFFTFRSSPFNPELGSVGVPEAAAMRAILDEKDYNDFPQVGKQVNSTWEYHKYLPYGEFIERYAKPKTTEEFCDIAQLLNFEQYRALMEGWASSMWNWYTGMIIWKIQNPWTALRGQMYDYYLDVNACYYGVREGGKPMHVQYNYRTKQAEAVNITLKDMDKCTVRMRIYQLDGKMLHEQEQKNVQMKANSSKALFSIEVPSQVKGAYFLRLELTDGDQMKCSDNVYWLTTQSKDYTTLKNMPASQATVSTNLEKKDGHYSALVNIKTKDRISFFNRVSVFNKKTGERILPVFYSDNYFTIFPNEEKTVTLTFDSNLPKEDINIVVKNWNK